MKRNIFYFGTLFSVIVVLFSCESNTYDEISVKVEHPTYVANVKPILAANCTSCHSADGGQAPYLETYDEVKDAIVNGVLIQEIEAPSGQGMPTDARMPQANIDVINNWVSGGFINQ